MKRKAEGSREGLQQSGLYKKLLSVAMALSLYAPVQAQTAQDETATDAADETAAEASGAETAASEEQELDSIVVTGFRGSLEKALDLKRVVAVQKDVIVAESLPLTALGKPDKKALRAQYWEGQGRTVG